MRTLVIQTITRQWDKSQRSAEDIVARQLLPEQYPLKASEATSLSSGKILLDQHGDDTMGDRIQFEMMDDDKLIIDRFGFDLNNKAVVYFPPLDSKQPPEHIATLANGWIQCQYEWRYRVYQGGFYYWLYELLTLNAGFVDSIEKDVFMRSEPEFVFKPAMPKQAK